MDIHRITELYVSKETGNDRFYSGLSPVRTRTGEGPLQTLEEAIRVVGEMRRFGAKQPVSIRIIDEVLELTKPIRVSGLASAFTIEPMTETEIRGGIELTGFKPDRMNGADCLSADLSEQIDSGFWFTDLYVNGKPAARTRFPEEGTLGAAAVEDPSEDLHAHSRWFIAEKEDLKRIASLRNFGDCLISYRHLWVDEHTPIESYDPETGKIWFKYASRYRLTPSIPNSRLAYYLENVAEAFRNPGEWYLDREKKRVYYIPREGETAENLRFFAPAAEKLFILEGTPEQPLERVTLRNLKLLYTRGDYRSMAGADENYPNGFASDGQSVCEAYAAVELSYAKHCRIENCELGCMGVHAIRFYEGCSHDWVTGCRIHDCGAGGVSICGGAYGSPEATHDHDISVTENLIESCGKRYFSACGILLRHGYQCHIAHNTIRDLSYTGISVGWVWGFGDSISRDNLIEFNDISHIGQGKLSDMGGIYLLGRQPGTIVRNNRIHDVKSCHYGGWGIYTDEGSSEILIEKNLCYDATSNAYYQHYGSNNTVRNNIFALGGSAAIRISRTQIQTGFTITGNILLTDGTPVYSTTYEKEYTNLQMLSGHKNLIWDLSGKEPPAIRDGEGEISLSELQGYGIERGSVVADPGFADPKAGDFTLPADSPAWEMGFAPIDFSTVGAAIAR